MTLEPPRSCYSLQGSVLVGLDAAAVVVAKFVVAAAAAVVAAGIDADFEEPV